MEKHPWSEVSGELISKESIRVLYSPAKHFRLFPDSYEPGASFATDIAQPIRVYVVAGSCKYKIGDTHVTLSDSEFIDLQKGQYWFEVLGASAVQVVKVFKVPSSTCNSGLA